MKNVAFVVIAIALSVPAYAGNLLQNSSFTDKDDEGKPRQWTHSVGLEQTQCELQVVSESRGNDTSCIRANTKKLTV